MPFRTFVPLLLLSFGGYGVRRLPAVEHWCIHDLFRALGAVSRLFGA